MEHVPNCPLCSHPVSRLALCATDHTVSQEAFDIRECAACGFRYTAPRPAPSRIGTYYLAEAYISHAAEAHGLRDKIYHAIRHHTIRSKRKLMARWKPTGSVLDVGCGTGDFLKHLQQRSYRTMGVEVSPVARKHAQQKGLRIYGSIEALEPELTFDVITLWHVLEHVPDPREMLAQLYQKCNEDGLLIIAVPDRESWDCRYYNKDWAAWDVPRHLSHFRRKDIHRILRETGFELMQVRRMWFDAPYVAVLSEQYRHAGKVGSLIKGTLVGTWSNLVALVSSWPTSSSLYVAEKPKKPIEA